MSPDPDPLAERLRDVPTWRVVALASATVLTALLAIVALSSVTAATVARSPLPRPLHQAVVGLPIVVGLYAMGRRSVLRAPASWFLAGRPRRGVLAWAAVGLGFPAALLAIWLVVLGATVTVAPRRGIDVVVLAVASLAAGLLAGVLEELAFRGAFLRLVEARWGPRAALAGSSAVFAVLHQGHASSPRELALVVAAMGAAGLLLGTVALRTRSVWNAVAVHAGWNAVFGGTLVAVGHGATPLQPAVVHARVADLPGVFAGAHGSPDTAPATTAVLLVAALAVHRFAGRDVAPGWPRARRSRQGERA